MTEKQRTVPRITAISLQNIVSIFIRQIVKSLFCFVDLERALKPDTNSIHRAAREKSTRWLRVWLHRLLKQRLSFSRVSEWSGQSWEQTQRKRSNDRPGSQRETTAAPQLVCTVTDEKWSLWRMILAQWRLCTGSQVTWLGPNLQRCTNTNTHAHTHRIPVTYDWFPTFSVSCWFSFRRLQFKPNVPTEHP